jgi:hypothetical protein
LLAAALFFWSLAEKSSARPGLAVAESRVHRSMKAIVRGELERERYAVVEEPLYPPGRKASWSSYRPDLLGYRSEAGTEELVLVECETHPNMKRFGSKNHSSVWFQPHLFRKGSVRRILAVPQGRLRGVNMEMRGLWEIWFLGSKRPVEKIGKVRGRETVVRERSAGPQPSAT